MQETAVLQDLSKRSGSSFGTQTVKARGWIEWALRFLAAGEDTNNTTQENFVVLAYCTEKDNEAHITNKYNPVWSGLHERAKDAWKSLTCIIMKDVLRQDVTIKFDESCYYKVQDIQMFSCFRRWFVRHDTEDFSNTNDFQDFTKFTPNVSFHRNR